MSRGFVRTERLTRRVFPFLSLPLQFTVLAAIVIAATFIPKVCILSLSSRSSVYFLVFVSKLTFVSSLRPVSLFSSLSSLSPSSRCPSFPSCLRHFQGAFALNPDIINDAHLDGEVDEEQNVNELDKDGKKRNSDSDEEYEKPVKTTDVGAML